MNDLDFLPGDFRKELKVDDDGVGYISKRGLARLCGVNEKVIRNIFGSFKRSEESAGKSLKDADVAGA
jgi:hypothetical protein